MMKNKTSKKATFEILGGYLMDNNRLNTEYLANEIHLISMNIESRYNLVVGKSSQRTSLKNVAIQLTKAFINDMLKINGYTNYYCTNAQLMKFDAEHENTLTLVINMLMDYIGEEREEYNN